ncbi:hypothetical protein DICPUDRAFT_30626 [Dictyostelium purpureum]|uniref:Rhodanese domain-containing protein n=1 Tax=Dictyostelium purpureum TaxID=5786 RepID=F0ZFQ0_DICPU|nr:uncharacterized protein DICPUDRAFT_30626 [Dictyostelium purpureum]EGC37214.1 hypothetical protein DICPUDRAFT_30626 [Dictyostelium purpureum]|eukprot:XP_003286265.1 hypothetical protein DICPUDRAFT_30626 [Dictyostelium purpureum]
MELNNNNSNNTTNNCNNNNDDDNNNAPYGLVDLRKRDEYENGHFINSTNIPLEDLDERMFELPPRLSNIGIVFSEEDKSLEIKTIKELILFKLTNYSIQFLINQKEIEGCSELKERQTEVGTSSKMLWKPCLYISENIETIESKLNQIYSGKNVGKFKAIDIACGSGRDCLFLANRGCWNVVGVDNDQTLLNKMVEASKRFDISQDVTSLLLELEPPVSKKTQEISNQESEEKQCYTLLPTLLEHSKDHTERESNNSDDDGGGGYDLVHVARYLYRPLFPVLGDLVKPGGFVVYHTFMVPGTKPKKPRFLLNTNELKERFNGFVVLDYKETHLDDGRPIQVIFAQRPLNETK